MASDSAVSNSRLTQVWILCSLLTLPALDALGSWFGAGPAAKAWWELGMNPGWAKARRHLI